MDLKETEARNECAGEDQQKSNRPTDQLITNSLILEKSHKSCDCKGSVTKTLVMSHVKP
jgi:hypothetical protein